MVLLLIELMGAVLVALILADAGQTLHGLRLGLAEGDRQSALLMRFLGTCPAIALLGGLRIALAVVLAVPWLAMPALQFVLLAALLVSDGEMVLKNARTLRSAR